LSPAAAPAIVRTADVRARDAHDIIYYYYATPPPPTVKIFPKSRSIRVPADKAWTRPGLGIKTPRFDNTAAAYSPVVDVVMVVVVEVIVDVVVVEVVVVTIVHQHHPTTRIGIRVRIFFEYINRIGFYFRSPTLNFGSFNCMIGSFLLFPLGIGTYTSFSSHFRQLRLRNNNYFHHEVNIYCSSHIVITHYSHLPTNLFSDLWKQLQNRTVIKVFRVLNVTNYY